VKHEDHRSGLTSQIDRAVFHSESCSFLRVRYEERPGAASAAGKRGRRRIARHGRLFDRPE
jgi:hypothetical protein